jgi:hypothetical protein
VSHHRRTSIGIVATIALCGCGPNWHPVTLPQPTPFAKGTVVEFRAHDSTVRLHAVQVSRDSISGIPWLEHTSCDTCRVRFAMADVSQMRTGNPGAGGWNILLPFVIIVGGLVWALSHIPYT